MKQCGQPIRAGTVRGSLGNTTEYHPWGHGKWGNFCIIEKKAGEREKEREMPEKRTNIKAYRKTGGEAQISQRDNAQRNAEARNRDHSEEEPPPIALPFVVFNAFIHPEG